MKKSKCNICSKKVNPKVKKKTIEEVDFYYVRCSKCLTVYPAYVEDAWVKDKKKEVEELQSTAWQSDELEAQGKVEAVQRILNLQKEIEYVAKTLLVNVHEKQFEKFGEGVVR